MLYFFFNNIVHSIDNWSCSGTATTYLYRCQNCSCRRSLQDIFNYCVYPLLSIWISIDIVLYITSYIYCITGTCIHRYVIERVWLTKPIVCDLDVVFLMVVHVQQPNTWNLDVIIAHWECFARCHWIYKLLNYWLDSITESVHYINMHLCQLTIVLYIAWSVPQNVFA